MSNDELSEILNYEPSIEQRKQIMTYARNNNLTPGQAANKFALPVMLFANEDNQTYTYKGESLTRAQLDEKYPFHKFVLIRT